MRALTLWQPWASLVAAGIKLVENRDWCPLEATLAVGDRLAIHAGKRYDNSGRWKKLLDRLTASDYEVLANAPADVADLGAVVAVATLAAVVRGPDDLGQIPDGQMRWFVGPCALVLRDVRALQTAIHCRGALNLWRLPGGVEQLLAEQLAKAA